MIIVKMLNLRIALDRYDSEFLAIKGFLLTPPSKF